MAAEPLHLEHVLGFTPPTAVVLSHDAAARGAYRLAYGSGSVVVLCDTATRAQVLLRGHRATVTACLASPDRALLVSADAAEGGGCSVLLWDAASGAPLAMVEAPHAAGTAALAWVGGGARPRYLVTLSAPHEATAGGRQEVALWDCAGAWAALAGGSGSGSGGEEEDPSPRLLASAPVPLAAGRQGQLAVNPAPSPLTGRRGPLGLALGLAAACATPQGAPPVPSAPGTLATVQEAWELATSPGGLTGCGGGMVFFSALHVTVMERLKGQGGQPSTTRQHSVWHITGSAASTQGSSASSASSTTTAQAALIPIGRRSPTVTAFLPGASAPALNTRDEVAGAVAAAAEAGAGAAGGARLVLSAGSATRVVAVSGTREGSLAQWVQAPPSAAAAAAGEGEDTLSAQSLALTRKALLKLVKVTRPAYQNLARGVLHAPPEAEAITALAPVPSGRYFLLGTADGCVRLYDLHVRLVAWWEELGGGGVLALPMAPFAEVEGGAAAAAAAAATQAAAALGAGLAADDATLRALLDTPQFIVSTERALAIAVTPREFLLPEGAGERSGELVLEGPGAAVMDLAVFSPRREAGREGEALLAVALASGCIHVWSPAARALLLVRELAVGPGEAAAAGSGSSSSSSAPTFTPTVLAADPLHRTLAVGTSTGFLLLLDPGTLGDAQPPIPPATWHLPVAQGGRCAGPPITHAAFSPDGFHLATGDAAGHVALYRYTLRTVRRPATSTSALTASSMLLLRKPWVGIVKEEEKWVEEESSVWAFIGRVKAHGGGGGGGAGAGGALSGLAFSPLLTSPHASAMVQWAVESGLVASGGKGGSSSSSSVPLPAACPHPASTMQGVPHKVGGSPWWPGTHANPLVTDVRHAACGLSLLASTGAQDKRVVVYDCGGSSENRGLQVRPSAVEGGSSSGAAAQQKGQQQQQQQQQGAGGTYRLTQFRQDASAAPAVSPSSVQFLALGTSIGGGSSSATATAATAKPALAPPPPTSTSTTVEQASNVSALAWLPYSESWEDCKGSGAPALAPTPLPPFLLANEAYKLRVWASGGQQGVAHQRTVQGPAFGGSVTRLIAIPTAASVAEAANFVAGGGSSSSSSSRAAAAVGGSGAFGSPSGRPGGSRGGRGASRGSSEQEEKKGEEGSSSSSRSSRSPPQPPPLTYHALAYATNDRTIGVLALPLDGSPYGQSGVVAHEGAVTALAYCESGRRLFSAGGGSVAVWGLHEGGCRASASAGPAGLTQYLASLQPGEHARIRDAFSYALIHSQGEASSAARAGGKLLPLPQLPNLLRGCGYFPTAWEERLVMGEAGALCSAAPPLLPLQQPSVDLPNVLRLLVNHRPVRAASPEALCEAAATALEAVLASSGVPLVALGEGSSSSSAGSSAAASGKGVRWGDLALLLSSLGDAMPAGELEAIMGTLLESEEGAGGTLLTVQLGALVAKYGARGAALPGALLGGGRRGGRGGGGGAAVTDLSAMVLPRLSAPALAEDALVEPSLLGGLLQRQGHV